MQGEGLVGTSKWNVGNAFRGFYIPTQKLFGVRVFFFAQIRELYEVHMMEKSILMIFLLVLSMLINK
jgi:hypothetical protein